MEEKKAAVQMRDITKRFGPVLANDRVWLDIYKGEILALLGENGSGKTTLMNMLSGIYFPDEGRIFIDGKEALIRSPKDAFSYGIGMIHQHFKLVDVLTAAENIILGLPGKLRLDMREVERDILRLTEKYGFEMDPHEKIYEMSVSQKQTVEIVKVLYRGADILILDEVLSVGDGAFRKKSEAKMREIIHGGAATILVSHSMEEVARSVDRLVVVNDGAIPFQGTPSQVFRHGPELEAMGLGVPQMTRVFNRLKAMGVDVGSSVYTVEQAKRAILDAVAKKGVG